MSRKITEKGKFNFPLTVNKIKAKSTSNQEEEQSHTHTHKQKTSIIGLYNLKYLDLISCSVCSLPTSLSTKSQISKYVNQWLIKWIFLEMGALLLISLFVSYTKQATLMSNFFHIKFKSNALIPIQKKKK